MIPQNPLGLGMGDLLLLAIAALLAPAGVAWRSRLEAYARKLAGFSRSAGNRWP